MVRKDVLSTVSVPSLSECTGSGQPTDAKKLDTVHRSTVTSSSEIPNVRLATPASPIFACHPAERTVDLDLFVDATEALSRPVENDLLGGRSCCSGAIAAGSIGSLGAILSVAIARREGIRKGCPPSGSPRSPTLQAFDHREAEMSRLRNFAVNVSKGVFECLVADSAHVNGTNLPSAKLVFPVESEG